MRRILLGCVLVAFGLFLGAQVANAQAGTPGPPLSKLVELPSGYDTSKAELVEENKVIFLLTKDLYQRKIYKVSMTPPTTTIVKYAVQEYKMVERPEYVPDWYEVEPDPSADWKYVTKK